VSIALLRTILKRDGIAYPESHKLCMLLKKEGYNLNKLESEIALKKDNELVKFASGYKKSIIFASEIERLIGFSNNNRVNIDDSIISMCCGSGVEFDGGHTGADAWFCKRCLNGCSVAYKHNE
jgi:hypothetical protein